VGYTLPHQLRQEPSRYEIGSSSNQNYRGNQNVWRAEDQEEFNGQGFDGDFRNFDQGYYDGNQGFGNGYAGGNQGNYRYRHPYRNNNNYQPRYQYNQRNMSGSNGSRADREGRSDAAEVQQASELPKAVVEVVSNLATAVVPSPAGNAGLVSAASSGLRVAKKR
jgi:hypothetical protein